MPSFCLDSILIISVLGKEIPILWFIFTAFFALIPLNPEALKDAPIFGIDLSGVGAIFSEGNLVLLTCF
ncbi:MAG: hypothetical protein ACOC4M_17755, partial [Promethearchaeia archaeon]